MIFLLLRGGSYFNIDSWSLRTTDRDGLLPEDRRRYVGFRLIVRREP